MADKIVIVNTGCANISSVKFAVERLGVNVTVSDDTDVISRADKVFLPGVGHANAAMKSIRAKGLTEVIRSLEQPTLGICLGMQLMVTESQEGINGNTPCLDLMPGIVEQMTAENLRLPHMGWNKVNALGNAPLFRGIDDGTYFYFVHSFCVKHYEHTMATSDYGQVFSAAINKDNFFGVQFHPERSSDAGAQLLKNFITL